METQITPIIMSNFSKSEVYRNMLSENTAAISQRIPMTAPEPGMLSNILSWFNSDPLNWSMLAFTCLMLYQIIRNYKNKNAKIGVWSAVAMIGMSIYGIMLHYNKTFGAILAFLAFSLTVQAYSFREDDESTPEEEPEPIKLPRQLPISQPIRPLPSPRVFDGFNMPSISLNDWFGRCL